MITWQWDDDDVTSGGRRSRHFPGEIDGTIEVNDNGNGGGNSRNGDGDEEAKYVEMALAEEETAMRTNDNTGIGRCHVVLQDIRQMA